MSQVIGRPVTFKDISHRVEMTQLANSPKISLTDAPKFLGVQLKTLQIYHRKDKDAADKCAEILACPDESMAPLDSVGPASTNGQATCLLGNATAPIVVGVLLVYLASLKVPPV